MTDIEKVKDLHKRMKNSMRDLLNTYATEASGMAVRSADPHNPVVQAAQIALANAAVDYMVFCGSTPVDALQDVINSTGIAMKTWVDTIVRMHHLAAKTTSETTVINDEKTIN